MPFKTVEVSGKKYVEVGEGDLPIFVHPDGSETAYDGDGAVARIAALNAENANRRHKTKELEDKVRAFEGIEDPEAAKEALETVKNLSAGELKTAAQVKEITEAAKRAAEEQVSAAAKQNAADLAKERTEREKLEQELHNEKIGGGIARSKYVAEKLAIPPDMVQSFFGKNFKVEDGKVVGYDGAGNKLFSKKSLGGELADIDDALEQLVSAYPNKEHILKGAGGGTGSAPGSADRGGLSKEAFDKLTPVQKLNVSRGVRPEQGSGPRPFQRARQ